MIACISNLPKPTFVHFWTYFDNP